MSFLNPFILFGLFAASLPILIHLFTRTKSRTIPFSTLDFLKELQNEQIRRIKLRQILLLILRTLIVILIILAFARPTLEGALSGAAPSNAKTSMAIILDNSVSMKRPHNGGVLYGQAQQHAEMVADLLRPGDEAFLVTTTDTSLALSGRSYHDVEILKKAIKELPTSFRVTDIDAALRLASALLERSNNINKEIYLLSDLQRNAFVRDSISVDENIRLYIWPSVAKGVANLSINEARLRSTILQQGKLVEAVVSIRNTGDAPVDNALLQLYVDERRVAQTSLQLDAGAAATKVFGFTLEKSGFSSARAHLEDDDLLEDNDSFFTFYVPENVTVGMVGDKADLFVLSLAVAAEGSESHFHLKRIPQAKLRSTSFRDFDVLTLCDVPAFDRQTVEKFKDFVENGGGLFFVLGDNVDIRAYNNALTPILQLPKLVDVIGSPLGDEGVLTLDKYDAAHPLFTGVFETRKPEFARPQFRFAVKVMPDENVHSIMQYSSGDPFLFEKKLGEGTMLVMTGGFDERLSDISRRTIFAPLMTRILAYAGTPQTVSQQRFFVGDEIRYKLPPQEVNRELEIKRPDGKYDRLKPKITPNGAWIYYLQTDAPGVYELLADGNVKYQWAVQLDPREMDAMPVAPDDLKNTSVIVLQDNVILDEFVASQRHGREVWKYFALAAFILLITEMLLYREKGEVPAD